MMDYQGLENLQGLRMSFSFLVIEISIKFIEIKYCTFLELVKEHFITIILRKMCAISKGFGRYKCVDHHKEK